MLSGDLLSESLQSLVIRFDKCISGDCQNIDTVNQLIQNSVVSVVVKNSYFDFNNI